MEGIRQKKGSKGEEEGTDANSDEEDRPTLGASERTVLELRRIRNQISAHLESVRVPMATAVAAERIEGAEVMNPDDSSVSIPTDLSVSELTPHEEEAPFKVLYQAPVVVSEPNSNTNLIPMFQSRFQRRNRGATGDAGEEELKRIAQLRQSYDTLPTIRRSVMQIPSK